MRLLGLTWIPLAERPLGDQPVEGRTSKPGRPQNSGQAQEVRNGSEVVGVAELLVLHVFLHCDRVVRGLLL
jgi:hypothetical protein